jgi:AcrR family transcriptional regulator
VLTPKAGSQDEAARRCSRRISGAKVKAPRPSARERNRIRTHNDIYDAAMSLFYERGYAEVTIDEICEQAGISKATFFRYFENKYGLVDEFNQRIAAKIDAAIDLKRMSAADCIRRATDTMYEEWLHSAPQLRTLAREFVRGGTRLAEGGSDPMARSLIHTLVEIIQAGQERGDFDNGYDADLVAPLIVFAWTLATISWFDQHDTSAFRESIHNLVELHIVGLTRQVAVSGVAAL